MNTIPGAANLGWGFNIFGQYSTNSLKSLLFDFRGDPTVWKDPISGIEYSVPANVSRHSVDDNSAGSQAFSTRTEAQEFFAAKAGLEASYVTEFGALSGAFNASYDVTSEQESDFQYGVYEANNIHLELSLKSQSVDQLTLEVQQEIAALPASFTRDAATAFFRFFDKFGTHYVSRVRVGGRLHYYVAVAKSYLKNTQKIKTDLTLEFNAVLVSAKAQSQVEWSKLTKAWTENRTVRIKALGGVPDTLLLAAPEFDDNRSSIYQKWVDSIRTDPVTVDFEIEQLANLVPAGKAEAVEQALKAYLQDNLLFVEARADALPVDEPKTPPNLPVVVLGESIRPDVPPEHDFGFQLLVMRPTDGTYEVYLDKYYSTDLYAKGADYTVVYKQMLADLHAGRYTVPGYVLVLASFNWYWQAPPTSEFYGFLRSAGAGAKLEEWMDGVSEFELGSISSQDSVYILVGSTGTAPGTGAEALAKAPMDGAHLTAHVTARLQGVDIHPVIAPATFAKTRTA